MESLLCDEVWLSGPETDGCCDHHEPPQKWRSFERGDGSCKQECDETNVMYLEKELCYSPESGYVDYLLSNNDLMQSRSRAIQWFIRSRSRLNLSFVTVFNAANYLDRFISMNHYQGWRYWMIELLSVACLSVASKFTETSAPSLLEIQMEDLDYCFQPHTIKRMELTLLQALGWRLCCITTYSYLELLISNLDSMDCHVLNELSTRVTKVLLGYIIDFQLLEYRPSVVAVSALWYSLEGLMLSSHAHLAHVTKLFKHDQKDDVVKCHKIIKSRGEDPLCNIRVCGQACYWPSSPVTVLLRERIDIYDCKVDLSMFKNIIPAAGSHLESCKKRRV